MKRTLVLSATATFAAAPALFGATLFAACQSTSGGDQAPPAQTSKIPQPDAGTDAGPTQQIPCNISINVRTAYMNYEAPAMPTLGQSPSFTNVRLGLGGGITKGAADYADPSTSFGVMWESDMDTHATAIWFGNSADSSTWSAGDVSTGVTWVMATDGLSDTTAPQRMHEAYVCGLKPNTTYYYKVGGGPAGQEKWSDETYTFKTTPSDPSQKITIHVGGDSRGENNNAWQILQKRVLADAPTLQLFSGDMTDLATDQGEWEKWLSKGWKDDGGQLSALGQVLTLEAHGNHDNHGVLFFNNVILPQDPSMFPEYTELFYSVDVGPAHIVVLDDLYLTSPSSGMDYANAVGGWLEADLTAADANRSKVPWVITVHHHPVFSSSTHGKDTGVKLVGQFLAPIWNKHKVDLDIAGHDHDYERTKPVTGTPDNATVVAPGSGGTVYLVCAGAGAEPYPKGMNTWTDVSHDFTSGGPIGSYAVLTIDSSSLRIEGHDLTADGTDPIFDTYTMTK